MRSMGIYTHRWSIEWVYILIEKRGVNEIFEKK